MLERLGRVTHERRGLVVIAWLVALVLAGTSVGAIGGAFSSEFSLPDVESAQGFDVLDEQFGGVGGGLTGSIVVQADQGVTDPEVQAALEAYFAEVDALDDVEVVSPFSEQGAGQIAFAGEQAGRIAYATVEVPRDLSFEESLAVGETIRELAPEVDGLRVEVGGQIFAEFEPPESEILGLAFAIFILIMAFGSVLAMGLPIGTALAGIGVGVSIVTLLSNVLEMPDFTTTLAVMIGLGVGIDYALFIVTRYREELHAGRSSVEATSVAIDTAGRAVLFAGTTVVISLLGMLLMGLEFVRGLGIGASITVAVTMVASVTLLPAILGFAQHRVEVTRRRGVVAAALVALALIGVGLGVDALLFAVPAAVIVLVVGTFVPFLRRELPPRARRPLEATLAYRWSRVIQAHPWTALITGSVVLVLVAIPVFSLRLGFSDEGNFPTDTDARQAYDLVAEGFGPGYNGPLVLVAELPAGADLAVIGRVDAALGATEGVAFASPGQPNAPTDPTAAVWRVIPETAPQDEATVELVDRLRADVLPAAADGTGVDVLVTGSVATSVDFTQFLSARLPIFFGAVLALSFVLLMLVFRSLLVPLKAVIMNLVSIGAAYGLVVAVFQWGWGGNVLGIEPAPIEPFVPMMLFAIVFGLSMDYEVFLLSRIRENYLRTGDNAGAVADGLASTARVITAAAAIMVFIFGSFLLESDRVIKLFGLGLASAVLLDATIVRMLLVPATMELLGDRNWWLPRWLDRLLPTIDVEGAHHEHPDDEVDPPVGERAPEPARV
ncbi:MAG TPA: MMPL family transporter [Acidimicrobiales bacterium]|nr:MMPL family transporter [Acidimicrobiales bacterium]